jgi:hypothetical protein
VERRKGEECIRKERRNCVNWRRIGIKEVGSRK